MMKSSKLLPCILAGIVYRTATTWSPCERGSSNFKRSAITKLILNLRTSTRSLYEKDMNYVMENGRRYAGQYFAPNDEIEQDRMHITHQTYLFLFNNQLTSVHLENPLRILDIGTYVISNFWLHEWTQLLLERQMF